VRAMEREKRRENVAIDAGMPMGEVTEDESEIIMIEYDKAKKNGVETKTGQLLLLITTSLPIPNNFVIGAKSRSM